MAYAPSPNTIIAGLTPHLDVVKMRLKALMPLEKDTCFYKLMIPDTLEPGTGQVVRWRRPNNLGDPGANPTQSTEGAVGTSKSYSTKTIDVKAANYSDYITVSSQMTDISMVNDLQDAGGRLGYFMALVYDNVLRGIIDAEYAGMARTPLNASSYLSVKDIRSARHALRNSGVKPMASFGGKYPFVCSPMVSYDYYADPDVGGLADLLKQQTGTAAAMLQYPKNSYETPLNNYNAPWEILESNNVRTGTSGANTVYYAYMLGDEGFGRIELSSRPSEIKPSSDSGTRFRITTIKDDRPSKTDPTGALGGFASANVWIGGACLAGPGNIGDTYRGYQWAFQSSIS